jgi:hypothetical protein
MMNTVLRALTRSLVREREDGRETAVKASEDLIEGWRAEPDVEVSVIVHVDGPAEQYKGALADLEFTVARVFRLTNTIAGHGRARQVLALLDVVWVNKVEPDRQITTMS